MLDTFRSAWMSAPQQPAWRTYWIWFGMALLLLVGVDLGTTILAVQRHGIAGEINPIMRWLLEQGVVLTATVHLAVLALSVVGFAVILHIGRSLEPPARTQYRIWCERWLAVLVIAGAFVVANNIAVLARPV